MHRVFPWLLAIASFGVFLVDVYVRSVGVPALDAYFSGSHYVPAAVYVVPIVLAAYLLLSPGMVAAIASLTLVLQVIAYSLEGSAITLLPGSNILGLALMSALAVALSDRLRRETDLREKLEITLQQVHAQNEDLKAQSEELQTQNEELKAQEEELGLLAAEARASEERYRSLYSSMSEGVVLHEVIYDHEGRAVDYRLLEANAAFETITGVSRESALGALASHVYGTGQAPYLDIYARVAATGKPESFETTFDPMAKSFAISVFSPARGKFATIFQDVTERKRFEAERDQLLESSQARAAELAAVVESTQAQLALLDRDMNFLLVNSAYAAGSGYSREELIGRNHFTLFPHAENEAIFERVRDTGEPFEVVEKPFEFPERPKAGTTYWNWVLVPIKDEAGRTRELLLSLLDVTEQVRARREIEKAVKARDEFLSIAAHELKTPVTSLLGYSQMVAREFTKTGSLDPNRAVRAMQRIEQQSKRLATLAEQLLDLSRLRAGRLAVSRQETDLAYLVDGLIGALKHSHPERVIEFRCSHPISAYIDPLRLEQVVTNLLDNALKFSPPERPVQVEVGAGGDGWAEIAVRDYGIGVPEDKRARIFERFYQAHTEHHYGGMGIGLFVSKQIVELHGGTIMVEQPVDGGSRFLVRLPISPR